MCPSFNFSLIVEILNFIALYRTDVGLSWGFTRRFCSQAAQICEICVKASPVGIFAECDMSETCLRHVTRPLVSTHQDYLRNIHEYCEMIRLNIKAYSQMIRLSNLGRQEISWKRHSLQMYWKNRPLLKMNVVKNNSLFTLLIFAEDRGEFFSCSISFYISQINFSWGYKSRAYSSSSLAYLG